MEGTNNMICPKCEEGNIAKTIFRKGGKIAYVCDLCEALWFKGEIIDFSTGHTFSSFSRGEELENVVDEMIGGDLRVY